MSKQLIIIGMGGHGKVIANVAINMGYEILGFVDDRRPQQNLYPYLGSIEPVSSWLKADAEVIIAIGSNRTRKLVVQKLACYAVRYATLVDPSAVLGLNVSVGEGTVIAPGAIINTEARIGRHAIVNTGATVDHDCQIEDYVHLSPGVHLAGGVHIGEGSHIGIGSSVIGQIQIGRFTSIGAGAAVIRDIPGEVVAVGVPAKIIKAQQAPTP